MDEDATPVTLVTVAILVSRVEALVVRSVLEAEGVPVCVGGEWHASAEPISLALGGHRMMVPSAQYELASAILRESGALEWQYSFGLQCAVRRFVGLLLAIYGGMALAIVALGGASAWFLLSAPLSAIGMPVNPQGRGDFYLAPLAES